jgi:homoserine O-acetyltransferase
MPTPPSRIVPPMAVIEDILPLGDLPLARGGVLADARIAYRVHGEITDGEAILLPHMYSGSMDSVVGFLTPDGPLDPVTCAVVTPAMLGAGASTSPSNAAPAQAGAAFPALATADDVAAQRALLDHLGVTRLRLALGFSMGAQQALRFAVTYPELVGRLVLIAGTARNTPYGRVVARALGEAITGGPGWRVDDDALAGRHRHARLMSILGATHEAFLPHRIAEAGVADHEAFIRDVFEADYGGQDANDLLCQLERWHDADVADGGDLAAALARVTCRTDVVALAGDRLFPPEEVVEQARLIPDVEVHVVGTAWGHYAMGGFDPADIAAVHRVVADAVRA